MTDQLKLSCEAFYNRAIGIPHKPFQQSFEAATLIEFEAAAAMLLDTQKKLQANYKGVYFGGVNGKSATLSYNAYVLRVTLAKPAKQTDVRPTSLHAFHTSDFSTQAAQVAMCIFDHSEGDITRAEIADILDIQEGRVSARVNALLKEFGQGGYFAPSGEYRLVLTGKRLSKCAGASDKPNEALRFEKCEPAPESGAQKSLFD